jgi:putative membrane protein
MPESISTRGNVMLLALLAATIAILTWSGIEPRDRVTWVMEVSPVLIAIPLLVLTYRSFPLTTLLYILIFVHAVLLMVGGHYTYAQVPAGFWVQDLLDLSRNHYDRLGHFAQGFVPAILAREVLLRVTCLQPGKMLFYLVLCICLAFSAFYEILEWWAAVIYGSEAEAFLATQGDVWDTQWDMFIAVLGAATAQLVLARLHDRQLTSL